MDLTVTQANTRSPQDLCEKDHEKHYKQEDWQLIALENWMELLDTSSKHSIFLAHGNWQARLAATAICVAQKRQVCILTDPFCWNCLKSIVYSPSAYSPFIDKSPIVFIY